MKRLIKVLLLLIALVVLGYVSNFLTMSACEQKIARWICFDILENQDVYTLPDQYPSSFVILTRVGAKVRRYRPKPNDYYEFDGFPWVAVDNATSKIPFLAKVEWAYNSGDLSGEGGETIFLCLFGIPVRLINRGHWVS
jgi:hypothetical protein